MGIKGIFSVFAVAASIMSAGFVYLCYTFSSDNPHLGIFSTETFDSIQDYVDRDPQLDSLQRSIGWKPPRGFNFYFNSLDKFSGSTEVLPSFYHQVEGLNEIIEPKGFEGRLE